jgi:hypothetical protein
MPSVCTFWLLPAEEAELLRSWGKYEPFVAFADRWQPSREAVRPVPLGSIRDAATEASLLLAPVSLLHLVSPQEQVFSGAARYGLSAINSCVVTYTRGRQVGVDLSLSNVAAYWFEATPDGRQVPKASAFVKWGKRVLATCRKIASQRHAQYRASPGAIRAFSATELKPVLY